MFFKQQVQSTDVEKRDTEQIMAFFFSFFFSPVEQTWGIPAVPPGVGRTLHYWGAAGRGVKARWNNDVAATGSGELSGLLKQSAGW